MGECWRRFIRCISNRSDEPQRTRYRTEAVESIKFENLLTVEKREKESRKGLVTDTELEHVKEGRLDKLVEDQRKKDLEREEQLQRQEEALRKEEEAYYASKREAARRTKQVKQGSREPPSLQLKSGGSTYTTASGSFSSMKPTAPPSITTLEEDEDDFDSFLEGIKAKQNALSAPKVAIASDSEEEEEVDFGYWEKANTEGSRTNSNFKEVDLNLL